MKRARMVAGVLGLVASCPSAISVDASVCVLRAGQALDPREFECDAPRCTLIAATDMSARLPEFCRDGLRWDLMHETGIKYVWAANLTDVRLRELHSRFAPMHGGPRCPRTYERGRELHASVHRTDAVALRLHAAYTTWAA